MSLSSRWAGTAVATLVVLAMTHVPLPGVDAEIARAGGSASSTVSVGLAGLMPFVSAMLFVEIAALLVPRWRPLRHGSPTGRATLVRWSTRLGLALAALQGLGMARYLASAQMPGLFEGGALAEALVIVTVVAATASQIWLARLVDRLRTVNGVVVLVLTGTCLSMWHALQKALGVGAGVIIVSPAALLQSESFARNALAALITVVATATILRRGAIVPPVATDGDAREAPPLLLPASSLFPLHFLSLPAALATLQVAGAARVAAAFEGDLSVTALSVVALVGTACTLVLHRPAALAGLYARLETSATPARLTAWRAASARSIREALPPTLVYLIVLGVAAKQGGFGVAMLAILVAFGFDVHASLRAERTLGENVVVWEDLRGAALPVAQTALARAGIASEIVGSHVLALAQAVTPYALASVRVGARDESRARTILEALFASPGPTAKDDER